MDTQDLYPTITLPRAPKDPVAVGQLMIADALSRKAAPGVGPMACATPARDPERRTSARMPVDLEVRLLVSVPFCTRTRHALVTDVGPGGLGVRFQGHPPEAGSVRLELINAAGCEFDGRFTWLHGGRWCTSAGICLTQDSAALWRAMLNQAAG